MKLMKRGLLSSTNKCKFSFTRPADGVTNSSPSAFFHCYDLHGPEHFCFPPNLPKVHS